MDRARPEDRPISAAMREYLAEIYRLRQRQGEATTSGLARHLNVSAPAIVRMLRRLQEVGLVDHTPYHGWSLTPAGEREALLGIRRHRLLEAFLVRVMGFGWDEVHELADSLDPGLTDAFEERMDQLSGYPRRCPHGDPIPTRDGVMPVVEEYKLLEFPIGVPARVGRVTTHDPERLRYLSSLELTPGQPVRVLGRAPFGGPIRLALPKGEQVIGEELAKALYLEPLASRGNP